MTRRDEARTTRHRRTRATLSRRSDAAGPTRNVAGSVLAIVGALALTGPRAVPADDFPSKPIEVLIPYAPGGGTDNTMRLVEAAAGRALGQELVLTNLPGGHGSRAVTQLMQATPDGYTLGVVPTGPIASVPHMAEVVYERSDFEPVIQLTHVPNTLIVPPDSPFESLADVIEYAKANPPGTLKVAITGTGSSSSHLPMVDLASHFGVEFTYIPHKGGGPALVPVMGGHVDLGSVDLSVSGPKIRSGNVRGIGLFAEKRNKDFPDLPTLEEQGADIVGGFFNMILAPKGTPEARLARIHDAFKSALEDPAVLARAKEMNLVVEYLDAEASRAKIDRYYETIGRLVKSLGMGKQGG